MQHTAKPIHVEFDAGPLLLLLECAVDLAHEVGDVPPNLPKSASELVRVASEPLAAGAIDVRVSLYPSDRLLQFCAALRARKLNKKPVKVVRHRLVSSAAKRGQKVLP